MGKDGKSQEKEEKKGRKHAADFCPLSFVDTFVLVSLVAAGLRIPRG
jgi:hypothetical protein